jgi:hypothetical protein
MDPSAWLAVASGVGVAAACGLRAFLPLLVLGLLARVGWVELAASVRWLSGDFSLIALGVATVLELAADKIPIVDHVLDTVGLALRPAAAWLGAYALLYQWPAPWGQAVSLALALVALGIQGAKAKLRLGSTVATFGVGNPVLSALEDAMAFVVSLVALLVPLLAFAAIVLLGFALARRRPPGVARRASAA